MDYDDELLLLYPENITSATNDSVYIYHATNAEIALECFKLLACFIGTAVDILMIVIIGKYKNLKKPLNIYIMNWLICDGMFILLDPLEYRIYSILARLEAERETLCIFFSCITIIRTLSIMFMILLLLQWIFDRTKIEVFERHCWKFVAGVWIIGLLETILEVTACTLEHVYSYFSDVFALIAMLFLLISIVVIHCMRKCSNPFNDSTSLSVALITSFLLSWASVIFLSILFHSIQHVIIRVIFYSGQLLIYLYPLLMFYLFYKLDPMFAVCVRLLFRLPKPEEAIATFEELDDEEHPAVV